MRLHNKKAEGKMIVSGYWIFLVVIIAVGVVAAINIFYSADFDVRKTEAEVLYSSLFDCVVEQGFVVDSFFEEDFDVFQNCGLSEEILSNSGNFYFNIKFYDRNENLIKDLEYGAKSFEINCEIQSGFENSQGTIAEEFPKCSKSKQTVLYFVDGKAESGQIEILTASNQQGERK